VIKYDRAIEWCKNMCIGVVATSYLINRCYVNGVLPWHDEVLTESMYCLRETD
jgi:hypothetical protein